MSKIELKVENVLKTGTNKNSVFARFVKVNKNVPNISEHSARSTWIRYGPRTIRKKKEEVWLVRLKRPQSTLNVRKSRPT